MRIKRYQAQSIKEAIKMVRDELGPDAIILSLREIDQRNGAIGKIVEVSAAIDREEDTIHHPAFHEKMEYLIFQIKNEISSLKKEIQRQIQRDSKFPIELSEFQSIARYISLNFDRSRKPLFVMPESIPIYQRMIDEGVSDQYARRVIRTMEKYLERQKGPNPAFAKKVCLEIIGRMMRVSAPFELDAQNQKFLAFIGPTGAGKTTTIAKLAAHFSMKRKKRVGLVTMDTYRIAAVEQLKTYARIMGLPLKVAGSPDSLQSILKQLEFYDLILIDTPGLSPKNEAKIEELGILMDLGMPVEKHLVMSANTNFTDLKETVKIYRKIGFDRILFTKLDESSHLGNLLTLNLETKKPLSYITFGQKVPDDIAVANGRLIGKIVLGLIDKEIFFQKKDLMEGK